LDLLKIGSTGLKKHDSFSRWMNKELMGVVDLDIKSSSDTVWSSMETLNFSDGSTVLTKEQLDAYVVSPSLSQDQLFSILDVSPSCAYIGLNTKVCKLFCGLNFILYNCTVQHFRHLRIDHFS
jgi:calmodulin-binding transcription activator